MRKVEIFAVCAILVLTLVAITSPFFLVKAASPLVWTDKPDYSPEETVIVYGSGFGHSIGVAVTVDRPNGVNDTVLAVTDALGDFTCSYQLDGVQGTYEVTATDGELTAKITFTDRAYKDVFVTTTAGGSVICQFPAASPTSTITVPSGSSGFHFTVYAGYKISFTAVPASGYVFAGWTGLRDASSNPQVIEVGSGKTVTATFILVLPVPVVPLGTLTALLTMIATLGACFALVKRFSGSRKCIA